MNGWEIAFGILGVASVGGVASWFYIRPQIRKYRAETNKAIVDAAVAEETAEDAHLKTVVEFLVDPLKRRVDDLENEVGQLREEIRTVRKKYYRLVDWARDVITWARLWPVEGRPPMPSVPSEVLDDL